MELSEELKTYPTATLERLIGRWQNVQKTQPFGSRDWQAASDGLAPLFAEMARRQKANGGEPDSGKWK